MAFNAAVTGWHITDWIWQTSPETRRLMGSRFKIQFGEGTPNGIRVGLGRFQNAVAEECRELSFGLHRAKQDFSEVTTRVDEIIRTQKFQGAAADLLNPNIIARDLGLADKSELTGKDGGPVEIRRIERVIVEAPSRVTN